MTYFLMYFLALDIQTVSVLSFSFRTHGEGLQSATLQSMMNINLIKQRFLTFVHTNEIRLIKTIQILAHQNLSLRFESIWLSWIKLESCKKEKLLVWRACLFSQEFFVCPKVSTYFYSSNLCLYRVGFSAKLLRLV